ncbi:hypothetical protein ACFFGV_11635 [Pontibacillus salicampi]|uniref:YhfH family protein n=1 Tax=Pontibacillus salicampi TaxID=1449801 RepID=A0ABV6LP82_9BACI
MTDLEGELWGGVHEPAVKCARCGKMISSRQEVTRNVCATCESIARGEEQEE